MRGRWTTKEMGSVVVAADIGDDTDEQDAVNGDSGAAGIKFRNTDEAERTLADSRFVIGDFVDCAVFPPLADGSVAPGGHRGSFAGGVSSRPMGNLGPQAPRENGYGRTRGGGYGLGRGDGPGGPGRGREFGGERVPPGEWRRGRDYQTVGMGEDLELEEGGTEVATEEIHPQRHVQQILRSCWLRLGPDNPAWAQCPLFTIRCSSHVSHKPRDIAGSSVDSSWSLRGRKTEDQPLISQMLPAILCIDVSMTSCHETIFGLPNFGPFQGSR